MKASKKGICGWQRSAEIAVGDQQPEGGGTTVDAGAPLTTSEKTSCVPEKSSWQHTGKLEAIKTSESPQRGLNSMAK